MPTYEYACTACDRHFDLRQGFDAEPVAPCPHCEGESRRVLHSPFIVYKASGFYTSDQRRNGRGNYWYNKELKDDQNAAKDAKGEAENGPDPAPPTTVADPADSSD